MLSNVCVIFTQNRHILKNVAVSAFVLVLFIYLVHPFRFGTNTYTHIVESDIVHELDPSPLALKLAAGRNEPLCALIPKEENDTLLYPNESILESDIAGLAETLDIHQGGAWQPKECISQHQVAIVIPYRNRPSQLNIFLGYMHPFLQKQFLNYRILVVEQSRQHSFNRAKLFNIGFKEALKIFPYHCFIFHDVDLIPQKLSNIYACTHQPRHMSSSLNTFRYNLPYKGLFGGAISIQHRQFELVNGFSNNFFGWGGEDDDFQERVRNKGMQICRFAPNVARYYMIAHTKAVPSENRYSNLAAGRERYEIDGINSVQYTVKKIAYKPLYTWILVDL